jgi:succinyl-diaminopimelate desuccinylase
MLIYHKMSLNPSSPSVSAPCAAVGLSFSGKTVFTAATACAPAHKASASGVDAINLGPGDPAYAHRRDERIDVHVLTRPA